MSDLANSYALCQRQARQAGSNFHYCFYFLPRAKRLAMCALYAFLRRADDIGDAAAGTVRNLGEANGDGSFDRHDQLDRLRLSLDRALIGSYDDLQFAALADTVARYHIPPQYLYDALDGVEMDLRGAGYETFADLEGYCRRVASVVGQACIHVWGFEGQRAIELAADCGMAFQLTNILRDLREDALRGRVYLPAEDLRRFAYTRDDLCRGIVDARFMALVRFEIERAERFYRAAANLDARLHADGRRIFYAMFHTYHRLLTKIGRLEGEAFHRRVRLDGWEKLHTAAEAIWWPLRRRRSLADCVARLS